MPKSFQPSPRYALARAALDGLCAAQSAAAADLKAIPGVGTGPLGLTPDAVKFSPEYRRARARHEEITARLREFTARFMREFKREYSADRLARRESRVA